jgi:hypothetical protein
MLAGYSTSACCGRLGNVWEDPKLVLALGQSLGFCRGSAGAFGLIQTLFSPKTCSQRLECELR